MSAKKLQNKIFGTPSASSANLKPSPSDPGLTINIPKAAPSVGPPKPSTPTQGQNGANATQHRYRDRLITELGDEYKNVERHRLLQDERHERHWKRWGPYLSERQWVSTIILTKPKLRL